MAYAHSGNGKTPDTTWHRRLAVLVFSGLIVVNDVYCAITRLGEEFEQSQKRGIFTSGLSLGKKAQ